MLAALADAAAGEGPAAERAQRAGERWAEGLDVEGLDPVAALAAVFTGLGFAPVPTEGGLALRACPFLEDARRHPEVVCGVHRGLALGIAGRAGAAVELRPFQGNVCVLAVN
jgi:predicted ArsR family transcriptional regulator